jgi:hypothetical protein
VKQKDIKPCAVCGKGVMHSGQFLSTSVRVTRLAADLTAIQRQQGLEMMLGGSVVLASAMGQDADLLKPLGKEESLLVCDQCAMTTTVAELWEKGGGA